jgi:exosortase/archaeosortase family protein
MFLVRLVLLSAPLYLVVGFSISLYPMQLAVAGQSAWILESMGYSVQQEGAYLMVSGGGPVQDFHFIVSEDCTGWKSMLFLFALILAVPAKALGQGLRSRRTAIWKRRGLGLLAGIPVIWLGNLGRVVGVVLAERSHGAETAMLIHDYLWQLGMIAMVLAVWACWLFYARKK